MGDTCRSTYRMVNIRRLLILDTSSDVGLDTLSTIRIFVMDTGVGVV